MHGSAWKFDLDHVTGVEIRDGPPAGDTGLLLLARWCLSLLGKEESTVRVLRALGSSKGYARRKRTRRVLAWSLGQIWSDSGQWGTCGERTLLTCGGSDDERSERIGHVVVPTLRTSGRNDARAW
jgi:hypothetical protein